MKKLLIVVLIGFIATPSFAIMRLNPLSITCQKARDTVHQRGAVIFRWSSSRGLPLYDRFVRNSRYCDTNQYAEWKNIPTRDDPTCPVLNCQNIDNLDGLFIVPEHSL
jgi:hypothetical protein